jgi:hypothetical protein
MDTSQKKKKKSYATPKLETYGDIRVLTENTGMTGKIDGGGKNPKSSLP